MRTGFSPLFKASTLLLGVLLFAGCPPPMQVVPDVVGLAQDLARNTISDAGLSVSDIMHQYSDSVAAGNVISQDPAAGATVSPGSGVSLVISFGAEPVSVPNVVGQPSAAAQAAITDAGFSVGAITERHSNIVAAGNVISQDPAANTPVERGTPVAIVVSIGPEIVDVPNVVGLASAAAQAAITDAGFNVGAITEQHSNSVAPGNVISQNPGANTPAPRGSAVSLVISSGPDCSLVPDLHNLTQTEAALLLNNAGLALGAVSEARNLTVPEGEIVDQNPAASECVGLGSDVDIVVSSGPAILIRTLSELQSIGNDPEFPLDAMYRLVNDIDAAKSPSNFVPIGSTVHPFIGHFDGQGHTIYNLQINPQQQSYVGLFAQIGNTSLDPKYATLENLNLSGGLVVGHTNVGGLVGAANFGSNVTNCRSDIAVNGQQSVGGLIGYCSANVDACSSASDINFNIAADLRSEAGSLIGAVGSGSTVRNSSATGHVGGNSHIGGLVGSNRGALIDCIASSEVVGAAHSAGGLVGYNNGSVEGCLSTGPVTGSYRVGGLIGENSFAGDVSQCRATGDVHASEYSGTGGLIGSNKKSSVFECVAEGTVTDTNRSGGCGGLIGIVERECIISNCYATGAVSGQDSSGGLIGDASDVAGAIQVLNCYATGAVTCPGDKGGLIGWVAASSATPVVTACFWDIDTTGLASTFDNAGTGLHTAAMQNLDTFDAAGWDLDTIWAIDGGYPILRWLLEP